jgi:single-strand DNA-binding protein
MASFNKVILMGNLTRDPEVRYTPGGTAVTDLGLAVNRTWFDKNANEKKEDVTFLDVTLWGRTAEIAGEYLSKGRPVLIEGRLQMDSWQDKESGQNRYKLKIVGENMTMLGSGGGQGGGNRGPGGGPHHNQAPSQQHAPQQQPAQQSAADSFYDNPPAGPPTDNVPF